MEMSPCMCLVDRRQTGNGAKCIYKNCKNKYYKVAGKGIRFFRVPKEDARCRQWLKACGRVDLIKEDFEASKAYKTYRVCSAHFEQHMYNSPTEMTHLLPSAMPAMYEEVACPNVAFRITSWRIHCRIVGKPWVRPTSYKYCMVPSCTNTTITAPAKYFFYVPKDPKIRKQWCRLMNRNTKIPLSDKSTLYCCESHFNLEADAENYIRYKLVGGRMTLKSGVVPHIFHCQKRTKHSKPRSVLEKLCRKEIISTLLDETEIPIEFVSCNNDSSNDSEDMSSKEIQRMDLSQVPVDIKQEFDEVPDENSLDHPEYIGIKLENEDLDSTLSTNANEEEVKIESQDIKLETPVYEGNFVTCDTIKNEIDTSEGETHTLVFMSIHEQFRMEKNLIEAVRRRKILYDTSDASYMKTKLKLATWERIAREVAMESGSEAKVVWEKLRHCHRDALRRQKNCVKGGSSAVSLKPWRYQKEMEFLLPHMANRKKYANVIGSGDENNEVYENCREGGGILEPAGDESGGGIHRNDTEEIDLSEDSIFSHPGLSTNDTPPPPWKKMKTDNGEKISAQTTEISVLMNDPLYHFFMSMYETTKKMPETSQLRVKDRIFRAVSGMGATLLDISPQQPHFD